MTSARLKDGRRCGATLASLKRIAGKEIGHVALGRGRLFSIGLMIVEICKSAYKNMVCFSVKGEVVVLLI